MDGHWQGVRGEDRERAPLTLTPCSFTTFTHFLELMFFLVVYCQRIFYRLQGENQSQSSLSSVSSFVERISGFHESVYSVCVCVSYYVCVYIE